MFRLLCRLHNLTRHATQESSDSFSDPQQHIAFRICVAQGRFHSEGGSDGTHNMPYRAQA
jgi:hypothetical protein